MAGELKNRVGEKFLTNEGYEIEIIEYYGNRRCTVRFNDERGTIVANKEYADLKKRIVKNPFHKSLYGVGYMGQGIYKGRHPRGGHTKMYNTWKNMLERCYSEKSQETNPTYLGCTVDERWHNYQVFAEWFDKNYNSEYMENWQLDKDILIKGNKIYSPETCVIVPNKINCLIIKTDATRGNLPVGVSKSGKKFMSNLRAGKENRKSTYLGTFDTPEEAFQAYKKAKEVYIKVVADKYKHQITRQCYQALYNYQVEITD
jgi:hypothetical protein